MDRIHLRIGLPTLMIAMAGAVVLLGVGIAAARLKSLSSSYRSRAAGYAFQEKLYAKHLQQVIKMAVETEQADRECTELSQSHSGMDRLRWISSIAIFRTQTTKHKTEIARYQAKAEWYGTMKTRYQFAAYHPWLSVPPDPPEPE